jgi:hypothetical protein
MAISISKHFAIPHHRKSLVRNNLVCEIYYDLEWVNRKFAVEWWQRDGHFNDELYDKVLEARLKRLK